MPSYWLMKTEPDTFSFTDLKQKPEQTALWDGVRNYQARNFMRDQMQLGDQVFIYHSSTAVPAIAGIAEVVATASADKTAFDPKHSGYDEKAAKRGVNPWVVVGVKAIAEAKTPLSLKELREFSQLKNMALLRPGQRLSVQPVTAKEWHFIEKKIDWNTL